VVAHDHEEEEDQEETKTYHHDVGSLGAQLGPRGLQKTKAGLRRNPEVPPVDTYMWRDPQQYLTSFHGSIRGFTKSLKAST
jgi:hypothetical protein